MAAALASNSAVFTGLEAEVRWGYLPAAALGAWTLTTDALGRRLAAVVTRADAFRVTQQPLRFCSGGRSWPILELSIADGRATARLGPQEIRNG